VQLQLVQQLAALQRHAVPLLQPQQRPLVVPLRLARPRQLVQLQLVQQLAVRQLHAPLQLVQQLAALLRLARPRQLVQLQLVQQLAALQRHVQLLPVALRQELQPVQQQPVRLLVQQLAVPRQLVVQLQHVDSFKQAFMPFMN